jgi:hypothetical protein
MNNHTLSRRQFAHRAALLSATASIVPAGVILPTDTFATISAQSPADLPKLSAEGQAEAEARFQTVLSRYGNRLTDEEKRAVKTQCYSLQSALDHVRAYSLQNGDVPALFLKPLIDRETKPRPIPAAIPAAGSQKS